MNFETSDIKDILNYGIINIDKPIGPTSHKTVEYARKILAVKKAGHSGTLDPKVSGVLPVALGKATRVLEFLLMMPKEYIGVMHLHEDSSLEELESARKKFLGKIKQTPPRKSAVKRQEREREVYEFFFLEKKDKDILFRVKGQAGLYVRKLIHDFGNVLEAKGAHMLKLRRISVGNFSDDKSITLYDLEKAAEAKDFSKIILPMEVAVSHLARISVDQPELDRLKDGKFLLTERFGISFPDNELIAAFYKNKLISLMRFHGEKLLPDKIFVERIKEILAND